MFSLGLMLGTKASTPRMGGYSLMEDAQYNGLQRGTLLPLSQRSKPNLWPYRKLLHRLYTCIPYSKTRRHHNVMQQ